MKGTKLDQLVEETVGVESELREAQCNMKLTAAAFLDATLGRANTALDRIDGLEAALGGPGTDAVAAFIRRIAKLVLEPNIPNPPTDIAKFGRVYGSPQLESQLAILGYNVAEAFALGVHRATEAHPSRFGPVDNFDQHQQRICDLRDRRATLNQGMEQALGANDLEFDFVGLSPQVRDAGLVRACFRRWPTIRLGIGWPALLIEAALAAQPKPKAA